MDIVIYSKDNCPNCEKAKTKLLKYNPKILKIGKDISREDFITKFPEVKQVPQIIINSQHIGNYEALEKWLIYNIPDENF